MGYSYMYDEDMIVGLLSGLLTGVPSMLFSIATYVLSSMAIYTIAQRRGLKNPWMAWIPMLNVWLLGSISDQYQYVVRGENKSKRKWLLTLSFLMLAFSVAVVVLVVVVIGSTIFATSGGHPNGLENFVEPVLTLIGLLLPLVAFIIAYYVIRYMALYDIYKSLDPANCVVFLVLSILFGITEPFFLFFNRNKDGGMPPRRQEPVYDQPAYAYGQPQPEPQKPWTQDDKDYL